MALIQCPECAKEISDKATSCPNCGCPISLSTDRGIQNQYRHLAVKSKAEQKKTIVITASIIVVATILIVCLIAIVQNKKHNAEQEATYAEALALLERGNYDEGIELLNTIPDYEGVSAVIEEAKLEATYAEALALLEKGKYDEGIKLLNTIPNHKEAGTVLEEAKYESYAYAAVNAVKKILKNPDSINIYDVYFYERLVEEDSTTSDESEYTHPIIIMYFGAQNGFGGNTTSYASCTYDEEKNDYVISGFTDELDSEELDEDDDDYLYQLLSTIIINSYLETGTEVGAFNKARFNTVLKNDAYSAIKIIE